MRMFLKVFAGGILLPAMLFPCLSPGAVMNFESQLTDVLVRLDGQIVDYQVFDPARGRFVKAREANINPQNVTGKGGVIQWTDGRQVYNRFYDSARGAWIRNDEASSAPSALQINDGVVAWHEENRVHLKVYDLHRGSWRSAREGSASPITQLQTADGVAAWNAGSIVYLRAYNPLTGAWTGSQIANSTTPANLSISDGIVSWSDGPVVRLQTFDPESSRGWVGSTVNSGSPGPIQISGGVAAWQSGNQIFHTVYDPSRGTWRAREGNAGQGAGSKLQVNQGTVTWLMADDTPVIQGYNTSSGSWFKGKTVPFASFVPSLQSGSSPATVYFADRSVGASGWCWMFGKESSRAERSPHLRLSGSSTVALVVNGPHGAASGASILIDLGDIGAGSGGGANAPSQTDDGYQYLQATRTNDGLVMVTILGEPGQEISLEASTDGTTWSTIATLSNSTGTLIYVDPDSAGESSRLYRSKLVGP